MSNGTTAQCSDPVNVVEQHGDASFGPDVGATDQDLHRTATAEFLPWPRVRAVALCAVTVLAASEAGLPAAALVCVGAILLLPVVQRWSDHAVLVAFGLVIIATATPAVALFLPVTVPETFWHKGFRQAVAPVSAQFAVAFTAIIAHDVEPYGWAAVPLAVGYLLSFVSSAWVSQVLSVSQDRERALMELQRSREQLALANHRAGAEAERARMNREVHDGVTQRLVVIRMLLEAAHHRFADGDSEAASRRCDLAHDQAMAGLKELRLLLASTSPKDAPYADGELRAAIENAAASVSAGAQIPVHLELNDIDVEPLLPLARRALLIRVLREALNNAVRHAGATSIRVRAGRVDNAMVLTVEDDGVGLAPGTIPLRPSGHGLGLVSMKQNLEACGGAFALENVPTGGLRLTARIPLAIPGTDSLVHSGSVLAASPAGAHNEALV